MCVFSVLSDYDRSVIGDAIETCEAVCGSSAGRQEKIGVDLLDTAARLRTVLIWSKGSDGSPTQQGTPAIENFASPL